jgi:glutathione S-transferase
MKLETWLRMAGIPYEVAPLDMSLAPKGKIPFIVQEDGTAMGDSTLIVEHLTARYGRDLDAGLSAEQRAISVAFRRMMKENLYWVMVYARYKDERNWALYRQVLADAVVWLPQEHRLPAADMLGKVILEQAHGQGMGRHTPEEVARIGIGDLTAVSDYLGDKPFLMGERPTLVDATVYAYVANVIEVPIECAAKDFGRSRDNLVRYCQRMRERYFPELARESAPRAAKVA